MINTIGQRNAELALNIALKYSPEQALKINLVDELCNEEILIETAEIRMKEWCKIPSIFKYLKEKL